MFIEVVPATAERFADVAVLRGPRNEDVPACWSLSYRVSAADFNALRGRRRPAFLRALCARAPARGVLAYLDGAPVGWCALGPRTEMERLQRSRTIPKADDRPVWSVVCFVVRPGYRRRGVARALLDGGIAYARTCAAVAMEAYPVDTGGARISGTFAYVGTTKLFEEAGFTRILETAARSAGLPRWLMRLDLAGSGEDYDVPSVAGVP